MPFNTYIKMYTLLFSSLYSHSCISIINLDLANYRAFSLFQKEALWPLVITPHLPQLQEAVLSTLCLCFPTCIVHVHGVIIHGLLSLAFCITFSGSVHILACIKISFPFVAIHGYILQFSYSNWHLIVNGYLGYSTFCGHQNDPVMNIHIHIHFMWTEIFISHVCIPSRDIAEQCGNCLAIQGTASLFQCASSHSYTCL